MTLGEGLWASEAAGRSWSAARSCPRAPARRPGDARPGAVPTTCVIVLPGHLPFAWLRVASRGQVCVPGPPEAAGVRGPFRRRVGKATCGEDRSPAALEPISTVWRCPVTRAPQRVSLMAEVSPGRGAGHPTAPCSAFGRLRPAGASVPRRAALRACRAESCFSVNVPVAPIHTAETYVRPRSPCPRRMIQLSACREPLCGY